MSEVVPETTTSAPDTFLENLASSVDINTEFLDEIVLEHFRGKVNPCCETFNGFLTACSLSLPTLRSTILQERRASACV